MAFVPSPSMAAGGGTRAEGPAITHTSSSGGASGGGNNSSGNNKSSSNGSSFTGNGGGSGRKTPARGGGGGHGGGTSCAQSLGQYEHFGSAERGHVINAMLGNLKNMRQVGRYVQ